VGGRTRWLSDGEFLSICAITAWDEPRPLDTWPRWNRFFMIEDPNWILPDRNTIPHECILPELHATLMPEIATSTEFTPSAE